jgi:Spy/CpxP family protein refolding chaperone
MKPKCFLSAISIGFLSGFLGLVSPVQAQNPDIAGTPESRLETMKAQLNLSAEQMEKLKPLVAEESAKIKALKDDTALSDGQKKEQARQIMAAFREKLGTVLTAEQKLKLSEERQRRTGTVQTEAAQRLKALKEKLGLSDDQIEKIKPILAEEAPKLKALKEDKSASPEDRRVILKQSMERISAELTPEQKDKMREQLQKRPN